MKRGEVWWVNFEPSLGCETRRLQNKVGALGSKDMKQVERAIKVQLGLPL